jgi:hypothetical protein
MIARMWHGAVPGEDVTRSGDSRARILSSPSIIILIERSSLNWNPKYFTTLYITTNFIPKGAVRYRSLRGRGRPRRRFRYRSVFDERGPFFVNPLLNGWATPLVSGVVDQSLRHRVAEHD